MSKLKEIREKLNLTQDELAEKSGISVRTIQRIESGNEPKGHTLKQLASTLEINQSELLNEEVIHPVSNYTLIKIINLSSIPFTIIPLANIAVPLLIMVVKKRFDPLAKQIISVQILWLIVAAIIFMLSVFMIKWFSLNKQLVLVVMILLVLSNVAIILRNAAEIDKKGKLFISPGFSLI